jgi:Flp pilus assembly pilin Flp
VVAGSRNYSHRDFFRGPPNENVGQAVRQERPGPELIEYTLLMAFVALASAALFIVSGGVRNIWGAASTRLTSASWHRPGGREPEGRNPFGEATL